MHAPLQKASESRTDTKSKQSSTLESTEEVVHGLEDHRPESALQLKLIEGAEQSSRVHQLQGYQQMADKRQAPNRQSRVSKDPASALNGILQRKEGANSLPDGLRSGVEQLSGQSMGDVKVHRNSDKPAQLEAHAYAQGTDIHLAPGQEQHLPHEAWHVAQQKQGRVKPTTQLKSATLINDDENLEQEADVMGAKAMKVGRQVMEPLQAKKKENSTLTGEIVQREKKNWTTNPLHQKKKTLKLEGEVQGAGTAIKNFFGKMGLGSQTTFTQLKDQVDKYNAASFEDQQVIGKKIKELGHHWLNSHGDSTDPNDLKKKSSIEEIMSDLEGTVVQDALDKGIFDSKDQVSELGITEQGIIEAQEKKTDGFIDSSGKIKDKKGVIMNTSFMSEMQGEMKSMVETSEINLGKINEHEKIMRADAAIHTFFIDEKSNAKNAEQKKGVTKHAKDTYNSDFLPNILTKSQFPNPKNPEKTVEEDDLDLVKLAKYKAESFHDAGLIQSINEESDDDLATIVTYAEQVKKLANEEKASDTTDENESKVQEKRSSVLELVEDATIYNQKIAKQKSKTKGIIKPLYDDKRMAGWLKTTAEMIQVAALSQVTKMATMGLFSRSANYKVGGLASKEGFDLKTDEQGNFTGEFIHHGGEGEKKFKFNGPLDLLKGIREDIKNIDAQANKFKGKQPITGFFKFSGVLKQLEAGLAYITQIVSTVKTWALLIGTAFPVAVPVTAVIGGICEAIIRVIGLITKSSKIARLIFSSLVKIMNQDPALWGLVSQNFAKGIAEGIEMAVGEGVEAGYAAGAGQDLKGDAGKGAENYLQSQVNVNADEIAADLKKETIGKEKNWSLGGTGISIANDIGASSIAEAAVGDRTKGKRKGRKKPLADHATKAFETTVQSAVPSAMPILSGAEELQGETSKPEVKNPEVLITAVEKEEAKIEAEATTPTAIEKAEEVSTKVDTAKEEAGNVASISNEINLISKEVIDVGNVATLRSVWEKRIQEANKKRELMKGQKGSGVS